VLELFSVGGDLLHTVEQSHMEKGLWLATGNVSEFGREEILMGHPAWELVLTYRWGDDEEPIVRSWRTHWSPFLPFNGVAAGNVVGDDLDEVIIADRNDVIVIAEVHYEDRITSAVQQPGVLQGKDVLFYSGHGSSGGWEGLPEADAPFDFDGTAPVAVAFSCLTGDYEPSRLTSEFDPAGPADPRTEDRGIAEAMLQSNAAVYIGSTQVSEILANIDAGHIFFDHWQPNRSAGDAFYDLEMDYWAQGGAWMHFFVSEYNLYGDPRFGEWGPGLAAEATSAPEPSDQTTISIEIPDYVTSTWRGYDMFTIPGGFQMLEEDMYQVPYWSATFNYPAGQKIQDVVLIDQSDPLEAAGFNIPIPERQHAGRDILGLSLLPAEPAEEGNDRWYPDPALPYDWSTWENPEGTTSLVLKVYPFYYHPLRTSIRFHKHFTFTVDVMTSTISVDQLVTDQPAYAPGDVVQIDVEVSNSGGSAAHVFVEAVIRDDHTGSLVDGLPLHVLHTLSGTGIYGTQWDTTGFEDGAYYVDVALRDSAGNLLDGASQPFQVGITSGEVTALSATPAFFHIGDGIDISMVFSNTGTTPITGTAVVRIQSTPELTVTKVFSYPVLNLPPGSDVTFDDTWDTSGEAGGDYEVLAYVLYDSKATTVEAVAVSTRRRLYLPFVTREKEPSRQARSP
jgi:hypothetical protein